MIPQQLIDCYACYRGKKFNPDCKFYYDLIGLDLIDDTDECPTIQSLENDIKKWYEGNDCLTYPDLVAKIVGSNERMKK